MVQQVKDLALTQVTAVAQIHSLEHEFSYATGAAKKEKKILLTN